MAYAAASLAYMCAFLGRYPAPAFLIFMAIVFPSMIYSGYMIPSDLVPAGLKVIEDASIFKYMFRPYLVNQWDGFGTITCATNPCVFADGQAVLDFLGMDPTRFWDDLIVIFCMMAGFRIVAVTSLYAHAWSDRV